MSTIIKNINGLPLFDLRTSQSILPQANILETDNQFTVQMALPGYKKEDFKIEVIDHRLIISAEITVDENAKFVRKEFSVGSFERSFRLPKTVETDKISAQYENGILELSIPKKEEAKPKEPFLISIN